MVHRQDWHAVAMSPEAGNPWDAEADRFDEAPDHGLRDAATAPGLDAAARRRAPACSGPRGRSGVWDRHPSILLSELGHRVHGVDSSARMLQRAREKSVVVRPRPTFEQADVEDPPLAPTTFDAVLARHVVWALSDAAAALSRWVDLLVPGGRMVLIEGRWETEAGLRQDELAELMPATASVSQRRLLDDPLLWGRPIADERYLLVARRHG